MEESEMVEYFLQALGPTYFGHLISAIGKSFSEVVKMGGMVEEWLKSSKIMSYSAIKATTEAIQNGTGGVIGKKKKEDMAIIDSGSCTKAIPWNYEQVIVTYKGKEVKEEVNEAQGLTRSGICFAPEELRKAKTSKDNPVLVKKVVTEEEAEEFLRKMKALMKILNEAHVPDKISVNHLEKIANKIFEVNRVTFSDDKLPVEGTEHNRALYLMVKYEDSVVTQVLVDNGSSANICSLSTLNKLKIDDERIHKNNICVQVPVKKVPEGKYVPTPKITSALIMVAFEMLKYGFVPGKGLGASLQGIIQPVSLPENLGMFGLGFKPTATDVKRAKRLKQKAWALPKTVPRLSRSFVKPSARKCPMMMVPSSVVDIDEELIERFQRLFDDVNMVEFEEGSSKVDMQFVGPNAKLNNCKATPLPTRKESWEEITKALFEYKDIFAWSYDDILGLSTDLVVHKFPIDPAFPPVKQKLKKFKTDMSVKFKEEVTKQLDAKSVGGALNWIRQRSKLSRNCHRQRIRSKWHIPRIHNEVADALATLASMLHHPNKAYIDPLHIQVRDQHAYCNMVEEELDGYYWLTIERDCISFVHKCHQCQVHGELIHSPPFELHTMSAPWPFVAWGKDVIGPIEPAASNGHRFILVAIDHFTKWVEAKTFKFVTKKAMVDFVHSNIICRFGIPKVIITDNRADLNSHLIKEVCQ
ncbi:uncharacterized protein [Nicotiana sylvestris]|uniref:uncharacterized protein n=1 Tax=Nicotiana sylvestris TaxID=4096 RepID=UPI00388C459D